MKIRFSGVTHRGLQREKNEDCMLVFDRVIYDDEEAWCCEKEVIADNFLFAVADGVGGAPAGDFASQFALQKLLEFKHFNVTSLVEAIKEIHRKLLKENKKDSSKAGSATTIAGIAFSPSDGILVFNVGDARVYHIGKGAPRCVSTDDNLLSALAVSGAFFTEDKEVEMLSNYLLQSIGGRPFSRVKPHVVSIPPGKKEQFLICTDGLYKALETTEMGSVIKQIKTPEKILKRLVHAALSFGGNDNITGVFVEVEF